jgi:hypothetical protein
VVNSSARQRWTEGREYLRLSTVSLRQSHYPEALELLHQAHNLGRDNIPLHAMAHLRYVRFSLHEGNYRRALGHVFWAICSPIMVPIERKQRTQIVGEWKPAPRSLDNAAPTSRASIAAVAVNASSSGGDAR